MARPVVISAEWGIRPGPALTISADLFADRHELVTGATAAEVARVRKTGVVSRHIDPSMVDRLVR